MLVALIVIVTPARIAQTLYDLGQRTREHPLGWLLLATLIRLFDLNVSHPLSSFVFTEIVSIPPMIGHTTVLNLCGFTYGMKGFLVAAPASLVASTVVFVVLRYLFSEVLRSRTQKNETWKALEAVIVGFLALPPYSSGRLIIQDAKGLPLIILIRLSPFPPWVYSNSLFAVSHLRPFSLALLTVACQFIQSVSVWQFMAATICSFPRFLLYVFIGSRMASLSDGKQREHMDTGNGHHTAHEVAPDLAIETKVVNGILIVAGVLSGAAAGW